MPKNKKLVKAKAHELNERALLWRAVRQALPSLIALTKPVAEKQIIVPFAPAPLPPMGPPLDEASEGGCIARWAEMQVGGGRPLDYTCPVHNVAPHQHCPSQSVMEDDPLGIGFKHVSNAVDSVDSFQMPPVVEDEVDSDFDPETLLKQQAIADAVAGHLGKPTGLQWNGPFVCSAIVEGSKAIGLTKAQWDLLRAAGVPVHAEAGPVLPDAPEAAPFAPTPNGTTITLPKPPPADASAKKEVSLDLPESAGGGCTERWAETYVSGGSPIDHICVYHSVPRGTPCPSQVVVSENPMGIA